MNTESIGIEMDTDLMVGRYDIEDAGQSAGYEGCCEAEDAGVEGGVEAGLEGEGEGLVTQGVEGVGDSFHGIGKVPDFPIDWTGDQGFSRSRRATHRGAENVLW